MGSKVGEWYDIVFFLRMFICFGVKFLNSIVEFVINVLILVRN